MTIHQTVNNVHSDIFFSRHGIHGTVGPIFHIILHDTASSGYIARDTAPHIGEEKLLLLASRLTDAGEYIRLNGTLVGTDLHDLHLHAEFAKHIFEIQSCSGESMNEHLSYRIDEH